MTVRLILVYPVQCKAWSIGYSILQDRRCGSGGSMLWFARRICFDS